MDDAGKIIAETADRIFAAHCSRDQGRGPDANGADRLWIALAEAGLPLALEPEGKGQFGVAAQDALGVVQAAGRYAAPVPLADTMFANWLLMYANVAPDDGISAVAGLHHADRLQVQTVGDDWQISGSVNRVPWGRRAKFLAVVFERDGGAFVARVPAREFQIVEGENLAGEPRDHIIFDTVVSGDTVGPLDRSLLEVRAMAAGVRVVQMAGALQKIIDLTSNYAQERVQFGRPIGKFQAVQQNIAVMGGQIATALAAATVVMRDFENSDAVFSVAAAKVRAGEAAGIAVRCSHQVHGAIGFTQEYELHFLTKRLWSWRDEFGSEAEWSRILGEEVCRRGGDNMWAFITSDLAMSWPQEACADALVGKR